MSPKDKASTAAIIGNELMFQVIQKSQSSRVSSPFFPVSASDENKGVQGFQSFSFIFTVALKRRAGFGGGVHLYLMDLPVLVVLKDVGQQSPGLFLLDPTLVIVGFIIPPRSFSSPLGPETAMKSCPLTTPRELFSTECISL